jgi:hypothetical protein
VEDLVDTSPAQRRKRFDARRAEIVCAGAVILEQLVKHLGLESVTAVQRGLREGILVDLIRRKDSGEDHSLHEAALVVGRRFHFDEAHATQVTRLSLQLFDDLAPLHNLPASARPLLEVAGLLHDVGNAVSYQKHHRHSYYLIQNAEIPGLRERERELVARIARYHRRSPPDPSHSGMEGLGPGEIRVVRKLATLLRVADSLDRSHRQSIVRLQARLLPNAVMVKLRARSPLDLELWDATHEAGLFRRVLGRKLLMQVMRSAGLHRGGSGRRRTPSTRLPVDTDRAGRPSPTGRMELPSEIAARRPPRSGSRSTSATRRCAEALRSYAVNFSVGGICLKTERGDRWARDGAGALVEDGRFELRAWWLGTLAPQAIGCGSRGGPCRGGGCCAGHRLGLRPASAWTLNPRVTTPRSASRNPIASQNR